MACHKQTQGWLQGSGVKQRESVLQNAKHYFGAIRDKGNGILKYISWGNSPAFYCVPWGQALEML